MLHSELAQICLRFRFGSGLGQVWFMSCGRSGRRGPSGLEGLLDEPGIHMYGKIVPERSGKNLECGAGVLCVCMLHASDEI